MTSKEFYDKYNSYAVKAATELKIPNSWVFAQWAHETGWGTSNDTRLNNLAGLFHSSSSASGRSYNTLDQFVDAYVKTLKQDRYKKALVETSITGFARELRKGGYAEDSSYETSGTWKQAVQDWVKYGGSQTNEGFKSGSDVLEEVVIDSTPLKVIKKVPVLLASGIIHGAIIGVMIVAVIIIFFPEGSLQKVVKAGVKNV